MAVCMFLVYIYAQVGICIKMKGFCYMKKDFISVNKDTKKSGRLRDHYTQTRLQKAFVYIFGQKLCYYLLISLNLTV